MKSSGVSGVLCLSSPIGWVVLKSVFHLQTGPQPFYFRDESFWMSEEVENALAFWSLSPSRLLVRPFQIPSSTVAVESDASLTGRGFCNSLGELGQVRWVYRFQLLHSRVLVFRAAFIALKSLSTPPVLWFGFWSTARQW